MKSIYLGVGSNLGNREENLKRAKQLLSAHPLIRFVQESKVYETEPVGGLPQGKFLNAVWHVKTKLAPRELLSVLLDVEKSLGRVKKMRNEPRTIDLDILFYDDLIMHDPDLVIPHPRIQERWFVLKPLWDLAADLIHPVLKKSVCELLDQCHAPR